MCACDDSDTRVFDNLLAIDNILERLSARDLVAVKLAFDRNTYEVLHGRLGRFLDIKRDEAAKSFVTQTADMLRTYDVMTTNSASVSRRVRYMDTLFAFLLKNSWYQNIEWLTPFNHAVRSKLVEFATYNLEYRTQAGGFLDKLYGMRVEEDEEDIEEKTPC